MNQPALWNSQIVGIASPVGAGWRGITLSKTDGIRSAPSRPANHNFAVNGREGRETTPFFTAETFPAHPAPTQQFAPICVICGSFRGKRP